MGFGNSSSLQTCISPTFTTPLSYLGYPVSNETEFRVFLDARRLKNLSQTDFKNLLKLDLLPKLTTKTIIQIEIVDSTTNPNIQIADWICGALYRYYTQRKNGQKFYDSFKENIVIKEELFRNYWKDEFQNKKTPLAR